MKLYRVSIVDEFLAVAETEQAACDFGNEMLATGEYESYTTAVEFDGTLPQGWTFQDLIYHDGDDNITVAQAIEMLELVTAEELEAAGQLRLDEV